MKCKFYIKELKIWIIINLRFNSLTGSKWTICISFILQLLNGHILFLYYNFWKHALFIIIILVTVIRLCHILSNWPVWSYKKQCASSPTTLINFILAVSFPLKNNTIIAMSALNDLHINFQLQYRKKIKFVAIFFSIISRNGTFPSPLSLCRLCEEHWT